VSVTRGRHTAKVRGDNTAHGDGTRMTRHDSRRVLNVLRSAVGTTPKRILAVLVGVLVLVAIATPVAFARQDTLAVTTQSLVVEAPQEVDGVPTYGANQSVTITGGVHYIPSGCLTKEIVSS